MTQPDRHALLVVTPHSSGAIPTDILRDMLGDDLFNTPKREALLRRIFLEGDPFTDLIYAVPGARFLAAPWSRFAVDLNRERDDRVENGVVKLTTFDRQPLYPPGFQLSELDREERLRHHWDVFDAQITAELPSTQLMVVGHCMAPEGPKLGPDTGTPRPAICLMTGTRDAPTFPLDSWKTLRQQCVDAFADVIAASPYRDVQIGVPWTTDTLSAAHQARSGIPAFGIEVNSGLYLKDQSEPVDEVIQALNIRFAQFADAALALVQS